MRGVRSGMFNTFRTMKTKGYIRSAGRILMGASTAMLSGCLMTGTADGCAYTHSIYITVDRESSGSGETIDNVTVYLFGSDRTFIESLEVRPDEVTGHLPIPISYDPNDIPWAVVWGNLGDGEQVLPPTSGDTMNDAYVAMRVLSGGNAEIPDNLLFGIKRLEGRADEEVLISPKTGRIMITVQGLTQLADSYWIAVETPYDRYDYTGTPLPGAATLNLAGVFNGQSLVFPQAWPMFHFPSPAVAGESLRLKLYRLGNVSITPQLLADVDADENGVPFTIQREQTTHVLIVLGGTGGIRVLVQVTGWDEIVQWDDW